MTPATRSPSNTLGSYTPQAKAAAWRQVRQAVQRQPSKEQQDMAQFQDEAEDTLEGLEYLAPRDDSRRRHLAVVGDVERYEHFARATAVEAPKPAGPRRTR